MMDLSNASLWTMVTLAVVFGSMIPIVAIITEHQRKTRKAELEHELKRDLSAQGKSPEEIQAILEIGDGKRS